MKVREILSIFFVLVGIILVFFFFLSRNQEIPKIIEERNEKCLENYTSRRILLSYKNTTFSVEYCIFSSEEEAADILNSIILPGVKSLGFNFTEKVIDGLKAYEYDIFTSSIDCSIWPCPPEQTGIVFQKGKLVIFCGSFSESLLDNEYVCKWYIGERLK